MRRLDGASGHEMEDIPMNPIEVGAVTPSI